MKKKTTTIERAHHTIDATGQVCGRLATTIAHLLRGKHKTAFAPHKDLGDFVVVSNIKKIVFSGKKNIQKEYKHFSGYLGGLKRTGLKSMMVKNPNHVLWNAVYNMLPANKLRRTMIKRLIIKD